MTPDRCPWYIAGPLWGLLIIGLRATVNKPFGALGGYVDIAENATTPRRIGFRASLLFGLVLGGALFSFTLGAFAPSLAHTSLGLRACTSLSSQLAVLFVAGMVMGFGARVAGGCTSGHGMSGVSIGSLGSLVAAMTFFTTAVLAAHAIALLTGAP